MIVGFGGINLGQQAGPRRGHLVSGRVLFMSGRRDLGIMLQSGVNSFGKRQRLSGIGGPGGNRDPHCEQEEQRQ